MSIVDMHVHMVGNGSGASGCWLRMSAGRWPLSVFMVRHIGLPIRALRENLEEQYVDKLLAWIGGSSLDAVVLLAQEQVYDEHGRLLPEHGTAYVPNTLVLELAHRHQELLPAVSIHPARADSLEELDRCLAGGAVMMKILPLCHNIDCRNRKYTRFWERMAEARLPLLAHTGGEHTMEVVRPDLADPKILEWPLQCGVTVIAAHCATRSGLFDQQYFPDFVSMLRRYPNFYGDISAFNVPIRGSVVPRCLAPDIVGKLVHGSDYPVPVFGHWAWLQGFVDWRNFRASLAEPNVLERDYQLKRAMGFPAETFTRINRVLRPTPQQNRLSRT